MAALGAFQLVDGLPDFTSSEKVLGKPVGNDLREGKVTLPLVYALEQASAEERRRVGTILRDRNYDQVPFPLDSGDGGAPNSRTHRISGRCTA